jgi:type I restriction-modification system DNA methylase subunit
MSASAKKQRYLKETTEPAENIGPGGKNLHYNNQGLFSDPYLDQLADGNANHSPSVRRSWDTEGTPEFNETYEWMLSTWAELKDILPKKTEPQLEDLWIKPILKLMGWKLEVQDRYKKYGKTEIPDYSLFESQQSYIKAQGCKTDEAYFEQVCAVGDAKQMGICLDGSKLDKTNPSFQIVWYLQTTKKEWGILTDGRYWRLYTTRAKSQRSTYYEVNIEKFLSERDDESFKYFFNFFRKEAFVKDASKGQSFLDVVFESGEHYAREVEDRLKDRAFHLAELICQGFSESSSDFSAEGLQNLYNHSLYYLFRLIFVLNCEAKGLLNVGRQSDYYSSSLRSLCMRIKGEFDSNQKWSNRNLSYHHINELFELLKSGDEKIGIHGLGKEAFSSGDERFYKAHPISDAVLNTVLIELAFAEEKKEKKLLLIDYKRLAADHLGSLFEGLLEFKLEVSQGASKQVKLTNSSGERKSTGSYYTPEHIVDYIVSEAISPLVEGKSVDEILNLKIIDPAMGSGHFLLGTVRFLENVILTRLSDQKGRTVDPKLISWQILHSCIYGIDINPLAVELAKFSLWMYTAKAGFELEPLNDQLYICNSLVTSTSKSTPDALTKSPCIRDVKPLFEITDGEKFDAVVGNPPYAPISEPSLVDYFTKSFTAQNYQLDLYLLFLERYEYFLKAGGVLGVIVSNTWLQSVKLRGIRQYLAKTYVWKKILHAEDKLFDATVDTHVLIFNLGGQRKGKEVEVEVLKKGVISKLHSIPLEQITADGEAINILAGGATADIFKAIRKRTVELKDVCDVFNGVKPFEKGKGKPAQTAEIMKEKPYVVEGAPKPAGQAWMPLMRGSLMHRYKSLWKNDSWIKYGPWLAAPRDKAIFDAKEKIIIRQTGDSIIGTLIGSGIIVRNNLHIILPKKGVELDLKFVLGLLNSTLIDFCYYNMNPEKGEALAEVKKHHVESLPVLDCEQLSASERKIMQTISEKVSKVLSSKGDTATLQEEIDSKIFELFGISAKDQKTIREICGSFKKVKRTLENAA